MTCIAGIAQGGKVWIGGDSASVGAYSLNVRADSKVFRNGPLLFGFTSSFRMGQLLRHAFTPPDHDPRVAADRWLATTFIDAVRQCLKNGGFARRSDDAEQGGTFLVGYKGRLHVVYDDYQVAEPADAPAEGCQIAAVGCGQDLALGSLFSQDVKKPAGARILSALAAAERYSAGVRGPFVVERL